MNEMDDENVLQQGLEEQAASPDVLEAMPEMAEAMPEMAAPETELPGGVQKRLGRQERQHKRELRQLQAQLGQMQEMLMSQQQQQAPQQQQQSADYYGNEQTPDDIQRYVQQAVQATMQAKQQEEQRAVAAKNEQMVKDEYQKLTDHLHNASDSYDDYEDVVLGEKTPYTQGMLNASLLLPLDGAGSASEVLYKLGKNPEELRRIAGIHPMHQARELLKLSRALELGGKDKKGGEYRPVEQLKSNPGYANSQGINENSPISDFKKRAREGWKGK